MKMYSWTNTLAIARTIFHTFGYIMCLWFFVLWLQQNPWDSEFYSFIMCFVLQRQYPCLYVLNCLTILICVLWCFYLSEYFYSTFSLVFTWVLPSLSSLLSEVSKLKFSIASSYMSIILSLRSSCALSLKILFNHLKTGEPRTTCQV